MVVAWSFYPSRSLRNIHITPIKEWTTPAFLSSFSFLWHKHGQETCHILMCSVRGISASLSPTIGEEIEVTGLTGSRLVSQQEGPVQLLRPQRTEGTRQLGHLGRLLPPTSWVWLWFLRGQMRLFQSPSLIRLENKNEKQNQNNPKSKAIFPFLKFLRLSQILFSDLSGTKSLSLCSDCTGLSFVDAK